MTWFAPIDLERHFDVCVRFRRDSLVCSFGHDREFEESGGEPEYLEWLRTHQRAYPAGIVHVWRNTTIIGQLEMDVRGAESRVNLFYLVPEYRGSGAGDDLHAYVVAQLREQRVQDAALVVSKANSRALRYYAKHGWARGGIVPGRDDLAVMTLDLRPHCSSAK